MVAPANTNLSIGKQCKLLSISRSSFYDMPKGETAMNLMLMRQIDEPFLETPFFGVRHMAWHLRNEGHLVNQKRIRRLMPIYQKPNTSKAAKGHKTYPSLLRGLGGGAPQSGLVCRHHVSADAQGLSVSGRHPLPGRVMRSMILRGVAWRISNTLEADFCVAALNPAIARFGPPEIMNTDQGSMRVEVNTVNAAKAAVLAGLGLWHLPLSEIRGELAEGRLVHVLPDWNLPELGVYAIWPDIGPQKALTRRLLDHFLEHRAELTL